MTDLQRELTGTTWHKSSHSGSGDQCVEVALLSSDLRAVRDSKNPDGPALALQPGAWQAFLDSVKRM